MSGRSLFDKVWDEHVVVPETEDAPAVLYIDLHLVHEVTSPQAFQMLRERGLTVRFPERTFATVDHIVPTDIPERPFIDDLAEEMMDALAFKYVPEPSKKSSKGLLLAV